MGFLTSLKKRFSRLNTVFRNPRIGKRIIKGLGGITKEDLQEALAKQEQLRREQREQEIARKRQELRLGYIDLGEDNYIYPTKGLERDGGEITRVRRGTTFIKTQSNTYYTTLLDYDVSIATKEGKTPTHIKEKFQIEGNWVYINPTIFFLQQHPEFKDNIIAGNVQIILYDKISGIVSFTAIQNIYYQP